jgi:hypothetical protein
MKPEQLVFITHDLNVSIKFDYKRLGLENIKDILLNIGNSSRITIRVPYGIEYVTIKNLLDIEGLTNEEKDRITIDFVED